MQRYNYYHLALHICAHAPQLQPWACAGRAVRAPGLLCLLGAVLLLLLGAVLLLLLLLLGAVLLLLLLVFFLLLGAALLRVVLLLLIACMLACVRTLAYIEHVYLYTRIPIYGNQHI